MSQLKILLSFFLLLVHCLVLACDGDSLGEEAPSQGVADPSGGDLHSDDDDSVATADDDDSAATVDDDDSAPAVPDDDCTAASDDDDSGGLGTGDGTEEPEGVFQRVRIHTETSPSWVSWGEIEVHGTWFGQDMEPTNLALGATSTSSSATTSGWSSYAIDGDEGSAWNAGAFPPAWIELELPSPALIESIRLRVNQSPPGTTRHLVQLAAGADPLQTLATLEGVTSNGNWLVYDSAAVEDSEPGGCDVLDFNLIMEQTTQACPDCQIWFWDMGVAEQRARLEVDYTDASGSHTANFQAGPLGIDGELWSARILAENPWWGPGSCAVGDTSCIDNFLHHFEARGTLDGAPLWHGLLYGDLSSLPCDATIDRAHLHLHINEDEGLANSDHSSVVSLYRGTKVWNPELVHGLRYDHDPTTGQDLPWDSSGGDFGDLVVQLRAEEDFWQRGFNKSNPAAWFDLTSHLVALQQERQGATTP